MAECVRFVCSKCETSVEAWSDGNPFYVDASGDKKYAYHPNHDELEKCTANDVPHLCMTCSEEVKVDSLERQKACKKCGSKHVVDTFRLEGVTCPKCKDGKFIRDNESQCIS